MEAFKTVFKEAENEITEKKSRFIAHIKPVQTEEEAMEYINGIKTKYWDARHNVYAYVLGSNLQKYSDDGEPQGTGGMPTLQVIKNFDLQNVVIVITRYFGGVLLGASGLARAYGRCAKEGLLASQIVTKMYCKRVELSINYSQLGRVQSEVYNLGYILSDTVYEDDVKVNVLVPQEELDKFKKAINDVLSGQVNFSIKGSAIITVDQTGNLLEV